MTFDSLNPGVLIIVLVAGSASLAAMENSRTLVSPQASSGTDFVVGGTHSPSRGRTRVWSWIEVKIPGQ